MRGTYESYYSQQKNDFDFKRLFFEKKIGGVNMVRKSYNYTILQL